jgi:hypothetical protein
MSRACCTREVIWNSMQTFVEQQFERPKFRWKVILKIIFTKRDAVVWSGLQ